MLCPRKNVEEENIEDSRKKGKEGEEKEKDCSCKIEGILGPGLGDSSYPHKGDVPSMPPVGEIAPENEEDKHGKNQEEEKEIHSSIPALEKVDVFDQFHIPAVYSNLSVFGDKPLEIESLEGKDETGKAG
jgi:hypothetical protein